MVINLDQKRLDALFISTLFLTFTIPALLLSLRLLFFAPFLITVCYQRSISYCFVMAFLCGLILDLLSSHAHFGLHSFSFCLAIALVYSQRKIFFADSLTTLPLMTFIFSCSSTLILAILLQSIESQYVISTKWLFTDLFLLPLCDACYAFCFFVLPALLFGKRRRKGKEYFFIK